jgi:hypothetical protein
MAAPALTDADGSGVASVEIVALGWGLRSEAE